MFSRLLNFFDTLRRTLGAIVMLAFIGLLGAALFSGRPSIPDDALLVVDPNGAIVEELEIAESFPPDFSGTAETRLSDLLHVLRAAKDDPRIQGILLDLRELDHASLPALKAIGRELDAFRKTGRPVTAYADQYSQTQYLAAIHADTVWLHPMGMLLLSGMSSYRNYLADALEKMHVTIHLFRAGTYKSAAEPLVRNDMSTEAREETSAVLAQLWQSVKGEIAIQRQVEPAAIQAMLDDPKLAVAGFAGDPAALAMGMHLVDRIGTFDEMLQAGGINDATQIGFTRYMRTLPPEPGRGAAQVGILTASGTISDGMLTNGGVNGDDFAELVSDAIEDDAIKAVVLRVDSPGGSVQASETIRRALARLRASGKPLVVSMGGMAASGGYWISAEADEIWASPDTLTGSIGVFGVFPNLAEGLQRLGIHNDGVGTTAVSGGLRPDRPLPPAVADVMQAGVDHVYATFTGIVEKGRKLPADKVETLAQGRVWTGTDAVRLGLVDRLGDLPQAVSSAAKLAGLEDDYRVRHIRPHLGLRERLIQRFMGEVQAVFVEAAGLDGQVSDSLKATRDWLRMLQARGGIYALSEFTY